MRGRFLKLSISNNNSAELTWSLNCVKTQRKTIGTDRSCLSHDTVFCEVAVRFMTGVYEKNCVIPFALAIWRQF